MGLYGGLAVEKIHDKKRLAIRDKILDYMGSEELIANLFRISQTESKLRRENIRGATEADQAPSSFSKLRIFSSKAAKQASSGAE
jgi:DNA-damage-inducible protein D